MAVDDPNDEQTADVMAVDAALTALAQRRSTSDDPALSLLAEVAQDIDVRAAVLAYRGAPVGSGPVRRRRVRLWRILVTAPATAALVLLVGMLPVNASPSSPLHVLHELIFSNDGPAPEDQVQAEIASATAALDHAGPCGSDRYAGALDEAGHHLADARRLLSKVDDAEVRARLRSQLSAAQRRVDEMAGCDSDDQGGGSDQDQGKGDGARPTTPGSEDDQGGGGN